MELITFNIRFEQVGRAGIEPATKSSNDNRSLSVEPRSRVQQVIENGILLLLFQLSYRPVNGNKLLLEG